jgi:ABC-type antimicrobial peptide transport system permease subunit
VAIVSNLMARTVWPGSSPLGQCLHVFADSLPCTRVVGVAEDVHRNRLREDPPMHFYIPLGQEIGFGGSTLLVRGIGAPTALIGDVRRTLLAMDPTITFADLSTVQTLIDPQVRPWRLGASVFALTGLLALLVAAIGIYSVTAYFVTERTHEIGIRLALGAGVGRVVGLIARGAVQTAAVGAIVGVGIAAVGGKFIQPLLFNESARDPVVFGGVAIVLTVVALLASVIPAGRAGRIDPLEALKAE